jgi:Winged helix-turn-helix DNA-binding
MPELLDTIRQDINARLEELRPLAREASDLQRALDALNAMAAAPTHPGGGRRRGKERQVFPRARSSRGDIRTRVIEFVSSNPGSTAGDVARALGLNRNSVATRLAQLAKAGELAKAEGGYAAPTGA